MLNLFPKKVITREDGTPYLIRYYLIKTRLFQIVIHKILLSDYDCLHDHPWNFLSIILKGGYWEGTTPEQVLKGPELEWFKKAHAKEAIYYRWFGVGSILFRRAEWKHSLKLKRYYPEGFAYKHKENPIVLIPCTSLVIMFNRRREWGFFTKTGWVKWFDYKSTQNCE